MVSLLFLTSMNIFFGLLKNVLGKVSLFSKKCRLLEKLIFFELVSWPAQTCTFKLKTINPCSLKTSWRCNWLVVDF